MPAFGKLSQEKLATCHPDIQKVMNEAIKLFDFTIVCGTRTVEEQKKLYAQGRTKPGIKVTNIDGVTKKSKHNHSPSQAVDIAPWVNGAIPWNDNKKFDEMAKIVLECAKKLGIKIIWGADWDSDGNITEHKLIDRPHFEI